jgi:hypothetical protein
MHDAAASITHYEALSAAHRAVLDALEARRIENMTGNAMDKAIASCRAKLAELDCLIARQRREARLLS